MMTGFFFYFGEGPIHLQAGNLSLQPVQDLKPVGLTLFRLGL
jgi:hypothetical protein